METEPQKEPIILIRGICHVHVAILSRVLMVEARRRLIAGPAQLYIYMYIPLYISSYSIHVGVLLGICVNICACIGCMSSCMCMLRLNY